MKDAKVDLPSALELRKIIDEYFIYDYFEGYAPSLYCRKQLARKIRNKLKQSITK